MISPCKIYLPFEPAKEWAKPCGLPIMLDKLAPMDWIVCDDFSIQVAQFLALADWASGYCWARQIPDLKSETVKKTLTVSTMTTVAPHYTLHQMEEQTLTVRMSLPAAKPVGLSIMYLLQTLLKVMDSQRAASRDAKG